MFISYFYCIKKDYRTAQKAVAPWSRAGLIGGIISRNMAELKRTLSTPVLTLYGLGNILGAGIYVLVGKVAGEAGVNAPLAFLIAMAVAALTAFSYMELSSRYPKSAGSALYTYQAFKSR